MVVVHLSHNTTLDGTGNVFNVHEIASEAQVDSVMIIMKNCDSVDDSEASHLSKLIQLIALKKSLSSWIARKLPQQLIKFADDCSALFFQ